MVPVAEQLRSEPAEILMVEDNPGDIRLVREALKDSQLCTRLQSVSDGHEALAFLRKQGRYSNARRPDLILLDLNLPRKDGREVLAELKADPHLRRIPVVIVTSSTADDDIVKSYSHHANCYITKPLDLERFIDVIRAVEYFWVTFVKLPPR